MGLITKEAEVLITSKNAFYYKRQSYICENGGIITVKLEIKPPRYLPRETCAV